MDSKEQGKFKLAYADVISAIDRGEYDDAKYFPSVASLAARTGVSMTTVWRVVNLLKKQGRLAGGPRCRTALLTRRAEPPADVIDKPSVPPLRQTKSAALQRHIQRDILNGRFRHDQPLPAEKALTAAYGVSRMTLRKALLVLTEQGVLSQRGARFSPMSIIPPASLPPQRIILLGPGSNMGHITYGYWHQESYKLLELECAKARMALDVVCFYREDGQLKLNDELPRRIHYGSITDKPNVAGYVYLVPGADSIEDDLLRTVAKSRLPVAIFDELGIWPAPAFLRQHPNVRVFRNTISALPAQQVARYLLELGHRSAVYISPFHHLEYSRLRYEGLARTFAVAENARIAAVTSRDELSQGPLPAEVTRVIDEMEKLRSDRMQFLPSAYRYPVESHLSEAIAAAGEGSMRESVARLCEDALKVADATAWVLVNDTCAALALGFLEERGVAVPGKVSVISFDDLPIALTNGISSFNFNYPAVMTAMLGFITNQRLFPVSKPVIEIEGQIIPRRRTVAPRKV